MNPPFRFGLFLMIAGGVFSAAFAAQMQYYGTAWCFVFLTPFVTIMLLD